MTPERWQAFYAQVADLRQLQRIYRRTIDPVVRREMEEQERLLDVEVTRIRAHLVADAPIEVPPFDGGTVAVEGGAR